MITTVIKGETNFSSILIILESKEKKIKKIKNMVYSTMSPTLIPNSSIIDVSTHLSLGNTRTFSLVL